MSQLSRGRPSIQDSDLPQNIKIALAERVTGKTWKDCALAAGIEYTTLRAWLQNNKDAKYFLQEKCDEFLDQTYFFMGQKSPEVAEKLYEIIMNKKTKDYVKAPAIDTWFRIVDKGYTQKNIEAQQEELSDRLYAVEGNKIIDLQQEK